MTKDECESLINDAINRNAQIGGQSELSQIEFTDIYKRLDGLDAYVKHMTYFCSGIGIVVIVILYQLHSKGIYSIPLI
jgi:hypothetical protein